MDYWARCVLLGAAFIVPNHLHTPSAFPVTTSTQGPTSSSSYTTSSAFTSPSSPAAAAPEPDLSSVGPWNSPCSSSTSSDISSAVTERLSLPSEELAALFQEMPEEAPSLAQQTGDVIILLQEALDLARSLQDEIFQVYLFGSSARRSWLLALEPVIPRGASQQGAGEADTTTHDLQNVTSQVTQQYRSISVAMVFLEQCRSDEAQGILRHPALSDAYTQLDRKLLAALCRLQEMLAATNHELPHVTRDVMPSDVRSMARITRDYIVARDVVSILDDALASLRELSQREHS